MLKEYTKYVEGSRAKKKINKKEINKFNDKHVGTCWNSHHSTRASRSKGKRVQPLKLIGDRLINSIWIHPFSFKYRLNISFQYHIISKHIAPGKWNNVVKQMWIHITSEAGMRKFFGTIIIKLHRIHGWNIRQRCRWYYRLWNDRIGQEKIDQKLELRSLKLEITRFDLFCLKERRWVMQKLCRFSEAKWDFVTE